VIDHQIGALALHLGEVGAAEDRRNRRRVVVGPLAEHEDARVIVDGERFLCRLTSTCHTPSVGGEVKSATRSKPSEP
jgi:hypothetical protein